MGSRVLVRDRVRRRGRSRPTQWNRSGWRLGMDRQLLRQSSAQGHSGRRSSIHLRASEVASANWRDFGAGSFGSRPFSGVSKVKALILTAALVALAGCAGTATSFPLNAQAQTLGPLQIDYTATGLGYAPVKIKMASGEVLHGTAHAVQQDGGVVTGFASGPHGVTTYTGVGAGGGVMQFVATGPQTQMLCRGTFSPFGHGAGECRTYAGALWSITW